jgi:hypothetical protein
MPFNRVAAMDEGAKPAVIAQHSSQTAQQI